MTWTAFDPISAHGGSDIDEEPQPNKADDLKNNRVIAEFDGELRATLYGILAFGKDPQRYPQMGNFWIECVAYEGKDRASNPLVVSEAKGRLDEQVKRAEAWFRGLGRKRFTTACFGRTGICCH